MADIEKQPLSYFLALSGNKLREILDQLPPSRKEELRQTTPHLQKIIEQDPSSAKDFYRVMLARQQFEKQDPNVNIDFSCLNVAQRESMVPNSRERRELFAQFLDKVGDLSDVQRESIVTKACEINGWEDSFKAISRAAASLPHMTDAQRETIVAKVCELNPEEWKIPDFDQDFAKAISRFAPGLPHMNDTQREEIGEKIVTKISELDGRERAEAISEIGPYLQYFSNAHRETIVSKACELDLSDRILAIDGMSLSIEYLRSMKNPPEPFQGLARNEQIEKRAPSGLKP